MILGRTLKVDHTRYKRKLDEKEQGIDLESVSKQNLDEDEDEDEDDEDGDGRKKRRWTIESEEDRPMLQQDIELAKLVQNHDEDDPMKAFLVQAKKEEIMNTLARLKEESNEKKSKSHKHRHHHRSRRINDEVDENSARYPRHQEDREDWERRRSHARDGA